MINFKEFYKSSFLFIPIILSLFGACNNHQKKVQSKPKADNKTGVKSQYSSVVITGITDDPKAFKYFNWLDMSYLFGENHKVETKHITRDSLFLRLDSINQSGIMEIMAFGDSSTYVHKVFVTPGDSISLIIKNKKMRFIGKNALKYNFFIDMDTLNLKNPYYSGNLEAYKTKCKIIYNRQNKFLNQYVQNHKNLSNDFITTVKADFKFRYLKNLMFLWQKHVSQQKTVMQILTDGSYHKNETIVDLKDYFDGVTLKDFERPELLNNGNFKLSFINYIHYYFADSNFKDYSPEKFVAEKTFILKNFKGKLQHFAIARLIYDYNTFSQTDNIYNLKTLIKNYKHNFSEPSYNKKIKTIENELNFIKITLPVAVLNSKLLNLKGDTLLVKKVLELSKNKIKTLDFWASWCKPCINEIIMGDMKRKKLSKHYPIAWIYFSIDSNKNEWIKKSKILAKYGTLKNQYLILDPKNSALVKFLNVKSIPRYVVLDKENMIVNGNAPRPSYENELKKIFDKINLNN